MVAQARSTFEDLEVWKQARSLRQQLTRFARGLPGEERFRLGDQIIRAARSVTANLAEGYGRYHYQEGIQFCRQARGSLFELVDHLTVALDEEYIGNDAFSELRQRLFETIRLLNGYIKYLRERKADEPKR